MEFEFSIFNFYRCNKGWQITFGELKRFDKPKSWTILRLTKQKNRRLEIKCPLTKNKSPQL